MAITEAFTPHAEGLTATGGTTSAIDTTGANLVIVAISHYAEIGGVAVLADSKSNTWTQLTEAANVMAVRFWYALSPTVGSGHTFTVSKGTGQDIFAAIIIHGFAGVSAFDTQNGASTAGTPSTSLQTGSVTPANNNSLIISGLGMNTISSVGVDSSLTLTEAADVGGSSGTCATGWKVQGAAAAINPTWSWTSSDRGGATIAVFSPSVGGGGGFVNRMVVVSP